MRIQGYILATALVLGSTAYADEGLKMTGKGYVDFTYKTHGNVDATGAKVTQNDTGTGLDVKRFYFGGTYTANDIWSGTFVTDIGDQAGHYDVFVKKAYVQAKILPELVLRAGSADLPWLPYVEDIWGFRYIENVVDERVKLATSADWGLHALGKIADGLLGYQLSVVNGGGYANPTRVETPAFDARINTKLMDHLHIAVAGKLSKLAQDKHGSTTPHWGRRLDAIVAWESELFRLGVNGFYARDYTANEVTGSAPEDDQRGISIWGNYQLIPELGVVARYDYVQTTTKTNKGLNDNYFYVGLEAKPEKHVSLALLYKHEMVKNGSVATTNGTITTEVSGKSATYDEVGLWSQFAF